MVAKSRKAKTTAKKAPKKAASKSKKPKATTKEETVKPKKLSEKQLAKLSATVKKHCDKYRKSYRAWCDAIYESALKIRRSMDTNEFNEFAQREWGYSGREIYRAMQYVSDFQGELAKKTADCDRTAIHALITLKHPLASIKSIEERVGVPIEKLTVEQVKAQVKIENQEAGVKPRGKQVAQGSVKSRTKSKIRLAPNADRNPLMDLHEILEDHGLVGMVRAIEELEITAEAILTSEEPATQDSIDGVIDIANQLQEMIGKFPALIEAGRKSLEAGTEVEPKAKAKPKTKPKAKAKPKTKPKPKTKAKPKAKPKTKAKPKAKPKAKK